MYKQYKHKLNMLKPGGKLMKLGLCCFGIGLILWCFGISILYKFFLMLGGVVLLVLLILVVVEEHEDKVLNEQALRLESFIEAGIMKKSFVLNYNGGEIWIEHLDSMGDYRTKVYEKLEDDFKRFANVSLPTHVIVNLDETFVNEELLQCLVTKLINTPQKIRKVAFVGLCKRNQRILKRFVMERECDFLVICENDFEKAKEWIYPTQ